MRPLLDEVLTPRALWSFFGMRARALKMTAVPTTVQLHLFKSNLHLYIANFERCVPRARPMLLFEKIFPTKVQGATSAAWQDVFLEYRALVGRRSIQ